MAYSPSEPPASFVAAHDDFLKGKDSPRDFVERCIAVIEERDKDVRAFVTTDFDGARLAADAARERYKAGKPRSLLDGCPVAIKDMINTADLPTQMNSPLYKDWYAPVDAACVFALRRAGAIVIGKTVTTEFAVGITNDTRNPFDLARTPGGSSSGSGAAVGAGMAPLALGSQTRGSVIRPAAFNGAVGMKPALGAIHTGGVHPLSTTLDHVGIIGASLADVWAAAQIMAAVPGGDTGHRPLVSGPDVPEARAPRRLALLRYAEWDKAGQETTTAMEAAVARLGDAGAEIATPDDDPHLANLERKLVEIIDGESYDILAYEMHWPFEAYPADKLNPRIVDLMKRAHGIDEKKYHAALAHRDSLRALANDIAERYDAYVTLACTGPAPRGHDETGSRHYQVPWTYLGFPCFTLPVLAAEGMPVGLQLMGGARDCPRLAAHARWTMETLLG